ncbi:MAG: RagB/SusD family nutrient uptake outer membrane protein [Lutibacter sp.]|uniref:RagB/SusD family nutrient uptake outer membrane protein n=1 Tax=Lutibacter sp. TaxID=1925666 RepID=UPI00299E5CD3|nr:RagB/SusD family nutrient uptake outer membrane protein [Lutibacter sp.]MDX1829290.1 RagB/SusD family nutrient uptake outer membrane protein [Lutibacter sp.]
MKNFNNNKLNTRYHKDIIWRLVVLVIIILVVTLSICSCNDFVEIDLPSSQLTSNGVFEEKTTANAAMTDIYSKIRDAGLLTGSATGLSHLLGNYADELDFYGSSQNAAVVFYNNSLIASNADVKRLWDTSYNQIYAANAVIEGVENSVNLPIADRKQLRGEALFVRSLIHFYLTNLFGDIPYITTTDYEKNSIAVRVPDSTIYNNIKDDLEEAIQLLPEDYFSTERVRPNKYTVYALLSRVNLYAGLWSEAAIEASEVINNTGLYVYEQDLDKVFLKESTSTIWQLAPGFSGGNTLESETFNFTIGPPPLSALSANFMAAFDPNDQREIHWTKAVSDGSTTWYHPFKYKSSNTGSSVEYSIVFRLGELYLIRAEARAHLGDLLGAKEDLNKIRNRAGLEDTTTLSQDEILDAILQERRLELFTEFGHRFFDLKRFNKVDEVLSMVKPGWDSHDVLFPIPETELKLNPNLQPQNQGY